MLRIPQKATTPPGGFRYQQPETGVTFTYGTWQEILGYTSRHRQASGLDLSLGWQDRLEHATCEQSPHLGCFDDSVPVGQESPLAVQGREAWKALHAFTETYPDNPTETDRTKAIYFLANWRNLIPAFGCTCRSYWNTLVASYAPDLSSREAFIRWGTCCHDNINRKLGKPIFRPDWFDASPAKDI